jgi:hypothetical protein
MNNLTKRTKERISNRFWSKVDQTGICWLWKAGKFSDGYGQFSIEAGFNARAHRVAWILTYGEIQDGLLVMHTCDTPLCVNPEHLVLGTAFENIDDARVKGRLKGFPGEQNSQAVLTREHVIGIRTDFKNGFNRFQLKEKYNISSALLYTILHYKSWKDIVV